MDRIAIAEAIAAALWLGALWYAAGIFARADDDEFEPAGRIRDAIVLGTAIPFAAAYVGLFARVVCVIAVAVLVAARFIRHRRRASFATRLAERRAIGEMIGRALPTLACVAVAWPGLVRPLLQGDSLGYHLPNAASWSVTHSLWTTGTTYWWYPGGSELFAAGLFAVAGPAAVGFAGLAALLLLAHRVYALARKAALASWCAGTLAAFVVTVPLIALQGHALENDVWLAAWLLEIFWAATYERAAIPRATGLCALVKPYGFVFAFVALITWRAPKRVIALALLPFALWALRDVILWRSAVIPPAQTAYPNLAESTIAAHGLTGLVTLARALFEQGAATVALSLAFIATVAFSRDKALRVVSLFAGLFYWIEPFGFTNGLPQLATGESLRFAVPAFALGSVGVLPMLPRFTTPVTIIAALLAAWDIRNVIAIFWIDPAVHGVFLIIAVIAATTLLRNRHATALTTAVAALGFTAYAVERAAAQPAQYYDDWLSRGADRSHVFAWIDRTRPPRVVAWKFLSGAVSIVSPASHVLDAVDSGPCAEAQNVRAFLILHDTPSDSDVVRNERLRAARSCGKEVYADRTAVVIAPKDTDPADAPRAPR